MSSSSASLPISSFSDSSSYLPSLFLVPTFFAVLLIIKARSILTVCIIRFFVCTGSWFSVVIGILSMSKLILRVVISLDPRANSIPT
ncbi:hypothetical protein QBC38DRAFT_488102 [Podospora fimiseda]|uniref:Uncharacterized protein n=1 Tax=Podospora fimiseda TaxID=252190 RepID=A0AAN7GNJ8_9PEZI|nr:hypothetical protein QBC38DRAFT_488102 [Podospora fimiseda]